MCHVSVIEFFVDNIRIEEFNEKRILEVGSKYVNGSVRPLIEKFAFPKEYIGVDVEPGKYVDIILPAEKLVEHFGEEAFDVVISTELLEHVKDWRLVVSNMKKVVKCGGYIYISQLDLTVSLTTVIHMTTGGMKRKICTKFFLTLKYKPLRKIL